MNGNFWVRVGAISAFVSVAAGAFGAHGLKDRLTPERLAVFETAARYQMYHALAMVALGLLSRGKATAGGFAGWSFLVGTLLFSGSLYALVLLDRPKLGAITPLGGLAFLAGWLAMAIRSGD